MRAKCPMFMASIQPSIHEYSIHDLSLSNCSQIVGLPSVRSKFELAVDFSVCGEVTVVMVDSFKKGEGCLSPRGG